MSVLKVTAKTFKSEVLDSTQTVVADFNADWCGPCRMLAPVIEQLSNEKPGVKFVSVNVDDEGEIAMNYGISSIPCIIVFKNGKEVRRSVGFKPKTAIEALFSE